MPDDDSLLAQGTVEFRQAERDHANGRERYVPPMVSVVLRGGPLDGMVKRVPRVNTRGWFKSSLGDYLYVYVRDLRDEGVWRYMEP